MSRRRISVATSSAIRMQRRPWPDPNVHRADTAAHQQCGWKCGDGRHRETLTIGQKRAGDTVWKRGDAAWGATRGLET
jgi:hypothetical protein